MDRWFARWKTQNAFTYMHVTAGVHLLHTHVFSHTCMFLYNRCACLISCFACIHSFTYMHVCWHTTMSLCIHFLHYKTEVHTCTHMCAQTYIHACSSAYMLTYRYMHASIHAWTHACMHTHTQWGDSVVTRASATDQQGYCVFFVAYIVFVVFAAPLLKRAEGMLIWGSVEDQGHGPIFLNRHWRLAFSRVASFCTTNHLHIYIIWYLFHARMCFYTHKDKSNAYIHKHQTSNFWNAVMYEQIGSSVYEFVSAKAGLLLWLTKVIRVISAIFLKVERKRWTLKWREQGAQVVYM